MQNLKPAKEFRALIANEESLDALLEIKGHLEYYLPEESGNDKRALAYLWRDVLWAIWGTASENGGSKVIKTAPKELKEKIPASICVRRALYVRALPKHSNMEKI